jgi:hypothetical protein
MKKSLILLSISLFFVSGIVHGEDNSSEYEITDYEVTIIVNENNHIISQKLLQQIFILKNTVLSKNPIKKHYYQRRRKY